MSQRSPGVVAAVVAAALFAAACGSTSGSGRGGSGRTPVVAAENFYGDIASQLGGRYVAVTSILTKPTADPHLFQPGTANAAAVADARLVIVNGVGYDAFMDRLLSAAPSSTRKVVTIANVLHMSGTMANPHLWYDVPKVPVIARAISDGLMEASAAHRAYFEHRLESFLRSLRPLDDAIAAIRAAHSGTAVAYTEPVPGYLLQAAGLTVLTPPTFARAIEEGNEPTPQDVATMEMLLASGRVHALLYNSQATSPITNRMRAIAALHGVPIVPVTETLPPGESFQQWQMRQVRALASALAR